MYLQICIHIKNIYSNSKHISWYFSQYSVQIGFGIVHPVISGLIRICLTTHRGISFFHFSWLPFLTDYPRLTESMRVKVILSRLKGLCKKETFADCPFSFLDRGGVNRRVPEARGICHIPAGTQVQCFCIHTYIDTSSTYLELTAEPFTHLWIARGILSTAFPCLVPYPT